MNLPLGWIWCNFPFSIFNEEEEDEEDEEKDEEKEDYVDDVDEIFVVITNALHTNQLCRIDDGSVSDLSKIVTGQEHT